MRNKLIITALVLLFLIVSPYSYPSQREQISSKKTSHNLKMTVEDIRYIGDSKYKMTILLTNLSTEILPVEINTLIISIQTNIIGTAGWIKVAVYDHNKSDFLLKVHETAKTSFIIYIPIEKYENLYKTYEGDISLKVESEVLLKRGGYNDAAKMDKKMEELYLWLRPGTNRWIFREGM